MKIVGQTRCFLQIQHKKDFTTKKLLHALVVEGAYDQEILISWDNCILMGIVPENFPYWNLEDDLEPEQKEDSKEEEKENEEESKNRRAKEVENPDNIVTVEHQPEQAESNKNSKRLLEVWL